jgi:hypothetical protein
MRLGPIREVDIGLRSKSRALPAHWNSGAYSDHFSDYTAKWLRGAVTGQEAQNIPEFCDWILQQCRSPQRGCGEPVLALRFAPDICNMSPHVYRRHANNSVALAAWCAPHLTSASAQS